MTDQAEREKWNVPDWRNADEYVYIKELPPDAQRWEFLRRTWHYRRSWDSGDYASDLDFGLRVMYRPQTRGDKLTIDFKFLDSSSLGCALTLDCVTHAESPLKDEFELDQLVGDRVLSLLNRKYCLIVFDPAAGLEEQIKQVRKTLKRLKTGRSNQPTEQKKEIVLLRIMDAYNEAKLTDSISGAYGQKQSIANTIWPDKAVTNKDADYAFKQAAARANRMSLV